MIMDDDDEPLSRRPKGMGKKEKSCPSTQEELDGHEDLVKLLKCEAWTIQYGLETAGLVKYRNTHVPGL